MSTYSLTFISEKDFTQHVLDTMNKYNDVLDSIDLKKFNSNIVDPIKLTFDMKVFRLTVEETITREIQRQRDKTDSNTIGCFHQNIFRYIDKCVVPREGFDVIFDDTKNNRKIYVEMKNKYNTMNSSSSATTYTRMLNQISNDLTCICCLVEVIAPYSRDEIWETTVNHVKMNNERIHRISIDKFYAMVTGIDDAFYQICKQLPITIDELVNSGKVKNIQEDTVISELQSKNTDLLKALYLLAFEEYNGFENLL